MHSAVTGRGLSAPDTDLALIRSQLRGTAAQNRLDLLEALLPGIPRRSVEQLATISSALSAQDAPEPEAAAGQLGPALVDAADATITLGRFLEDAQVRILQRMTVRAGRSLLRTEEGEEDPSALSTTRRRRWRCRAKSVVANEFQALSGYGIQDCHDRVGFAMAPAATTATAREALASGRSDWWQLWQWWKRCRHLDVDSAAAVADGVFGPVDEADASAPGHRPSRREFLNLLDREATRVEGADAVAARARRRRAVEARRAEATVDADGTGTLRVVGRTSTVAAAMDRIDTIARTARSCGDSRSLDQLRSDATLALLTAGVLPGPELRGGTSDNDTTAGHTPRMDDKDHVDVAAGGGWAPADVDRLTTALAGQVAAQVEVVVPYDVLTGTDPDGVALLTGHGYVTAEHARELVLRPGSTLYRLVTDPASGRLVDRSVTTYEPDRQMRAVIAAADRYCRGPGCTVPAGRAQADHVVEHPRGPTAVSNLAPEHPRHHGLKTNRWWSCVMDPDSRDLSWTSYFGRVYRSGAFDYRTITGTAAPGPGQAHGSRAPVADLQDQLVYAALAERLAGATLEGEVEDDRPAYLRREDDAGSSGPALSLTHTPPGGELRRGAPPRQPTTRALLVSLGAAEDDDQAGEASARSPGASERSPDTDAAAPMAEDEPPPPF